MLNDQVPTSITANKKTKVVSITWSDEHTSDYSFALLRHACPCAECRGGHEHMSQEPPSAVFYLSDEDLPATRLVNIEAIGTYGLTIQWEDKHQYGIYSWHYLKALCPCPVCREMMIYGR